MLATVVVVGLCVCWTYALHAPRLLAWPDLESYAQQAIAERPVWTSLTFVATLVLFWTCRAFADHAVFGASTDGERRARLEGLWSFVPYMGAAILAVFGAKEISERYGTFPGSGAVELVGSGNVRNYLQWDQGLKFGQVYYPMGRPLRVYALEVSSDDGLHVMASAHQHGGESSWVERIPVVAMVSRDIGDNDAALATDRRAPARFGKVTLSGTRAIYWFSSPKAGQSCPNPTYPVTCPPSGGKARSRAFGGPLGVITKLRDELGNPSVFGPSGSGTLAMLAKESRSWVCDRGNKSQERRGLSAEEFLNELGSTPLTSSLDPCRAAELSFSDSRPFLFMSSYPANEALLEKIKKVEDEWPQPSSPTLTSLPCDRGSVDICFGQAEAHQPLHLVFPLEHHPLPTGNGEPGHYPLAPAVGRLLQTLGFDTCVRKEGDGYHYLPEGSCSVLKKGK
jgi:hypothetical protein